MFGLFGRVCGVMFVGYGLCGLNLRTRVPYYISTYKFSLFPIYHEFFPQWSETDYPKGVVSPAVYDLQLATRLYRILWRLVIRIHLRRVMHVVSSVMFLARRMHSSSDT